MDMSTNKSIHIAKSFEKTHHHPKLVNKYVFDNTDEKKVRRTNN